MIDENKITKPKNTIYIDLDSILDTRLGLLTILDPNLTGGLLNSEYWWNRLIDEFGYITNKSFKRIYRYRNNTILPFSKITKILELILVEIGFIKLNKGIFDVVGRINLEINIWPYNLTDKEKNNIKISMLDKFKLNYIDIDIVDYNPYKQNYSYFNNNFYAIFMYNGIDWLKYRISEGIIKKDNIPDTRLYVPAILDKPIILNDIKEYEKMYNKISNSMKYFIDIQFLSIDNFSIIK